MDLTQLPAGVTAVADHGLPAFAVDTPACTATVHLHGAHVTAWTPEGSAPVLYLSPEARFPPGTAIRGGVPICFPWFGPGRDGNLSPSHGPVRLTEWEPLDVQRDGDDVRLTFGLTAPVARSIAPDAPYPAVGLSYVVTLGRELDLALTIHALADADVEAALHTYLAVEDVRTTSIAGLEGASYLDKVTGDETGPQEGAVRFAGETDRVYDASGTVALDDGARRLEVSSEGGTKTVVWNPWSEKAASMGDLPDDAWTRFVCIETAAVHDGPIVVPAGAQHTLRQRINPTAV